MEEQLEGYWWNQENPDLPMPVSNSEPFDGQEGFLSNLMKKEIRAKRTDWRGYSECRICKKLNGSSDYSIDGWRWPSGFAHYVIVHNVKPTAAFRAFICQ
jgi:hypothetical protein